MNKLKEWQFHNLSMSVFMGQCTDENNPLRNIHGIFSLISNNSTFHAIFFLHARCIPSSFITIMSKIYNLCDYWFQLWITIISELTQRQISTEIVFHTNEHSVLVLIKALDVLIYFTFRYQFLIVYLNMPN